MRRSLVTIGLVLVALGPAASAEAAANKVNTARFAVTVEGVQANSWSNVHHADGIGGCDADHTSHGTEEVRFKSSNFSLRALSVPGLRTPSLTIMGGGRPTFPQFKLRGTVNRTGDLYVAPNQSECGGPDSGSAPTPKDCGSKAFAGLTGTFDYRNRSKPRDQLEFGTILGKDVFANCPSGGTAFPDLLSEYDGKPMNVRLPRDELFDKEIGKLILIGRGRDVQTSHDYNSKTTSRWVITLVRK
jgi:hypothetical protein